MVATRNAVRVFISSTFRDMHPERDHLVRFVFPELEQRCAERGLQFVPVDLRWGVTREEAENGEALDICLNEIENCRPFFLCLLGERYGWLPLPTTIPNVFAIRLGTKDQLLFHEAYIENGFGEYVLRSDTNRLARWGQQFQANEKQLLVALEAVDVPGCGKSVTAQEIYRAVFSDPKQTQHSFFYMRARKLTAKLAEQSDSPQDFHEPSEIGQKKLARLKEEIIEAGLAMTPYDQLEALGSSIRDQLWRSIETEFPSQLARADDPIEEEKRAQSLFVQRLTRFFIGRNTELAELDNLATESAGYIAITGQSGVGKTALLANWLHGNEYYVGFEHRNPQMFVLSHFIGASQQSSNLRDLLQRFCLELAPAAGWQGPILGDLKKLRETFPQILSAAAKQQPILILLDALDQLEQIDNAHSLEWLPVNLPANVTLMASALSRDQDVVWQSIRALAGKHTFTVPRMDRLESEKLIQDYLAAYRKRLDDKQLALLIEKRDAGSPLYLQVALEELRSFGHYEGIDDYLRQLPDTVQILYQFVLEHLETEHGSDFVGRILSCLACGRHGMTEAELLALAGADQDNVAQLRWVRLSRILDAHLIERGNAITFYHRQLREAVERRYLPECVLRRTTHQDIASYFLERPLSDRRKLAELPWQQAKGGLFEELTATLTDFGFLAAKCNVGSGYELLDDYRLASSHHAKESGAALSALEGTLRLSVNTLMQRPNELQTQLLGRLLKHQSPTIKQVLSLAARSTEGPWVRPMAASLTPPETSLRQILEGHTDDVRSVAITPDGQKVVSGSNDGTTRIWDLESGRLLRTLSCGPQFVVSVAITPDSRRVIAAADATPQILDLETGKTLSTLHGHTGLVASVAVTADGNRAFSLSSGDKTIREWRLEDGRPLRTLTTTTDLTGEVRALALEPEARFVVFASVKNDVCIWDVSRGVIHAWQGHSAAVLSLAVAADGEHIVSAAIDNTLRVWEVRTGNTLKVLVGHTGAVTAVSITPDARLAISGSVDKTVRLWDLQTGRTLKTLRGHTQDVRAVAIASDGRRAVSASEDNTLCVWDITDRDLSLTAEPHASGVTALAVTPDGRHVVSASWDATLRVWDLADGRALRTLQAETGQVLAVAVTPDGHRVVSGSWDFTLQVWDFADGRILRRLTGHESMVTSVAVTPNGQYVLSASGDETIRVWDLDRGRPVRVLAGHSKLVRSVAVTPDGLCAVSASDDNTVRIWDIQSGDTVRVLDGHEDAVMSVAVTPDGRYAVSGSCDTSIRVWPLLTEIGGHTLSGHSRDVKAVALMQDGGHVVSVSEDRTLRVWQLANSKMIASFTADGACWGVAAGPGHSIIVGDQLGHVHFLALAGAESLQPRQSSN